jgi:hypothetical protein
MTTDMTNAELVATYVQLLIIEYSDPNNQPNALATIAMLANEAIANQVVGQVGAGFSINGSYGQTIAQGVQLNILAQWVGAQRILPGYIPPNEYYGFEDTTGSYVPTIGGMGDVTVGPPSDFWDSTSQIAGSYTLSDGEMIELIEYLAAVNNAYLSVENVDNILYEFFGNLVTVTESAVMQVTYTDSPSDSGTLFGIINYLDAFPHPAGVAVEVT